MKLTQKDRILYELREAGETGVRGDKFLSLSMPRYAARILELRQEGHDIRSKDDSGMARYRLYEGVGIGADQGVKARREESLLEAPAVEDCTDSGKPRGVIPPDRTLPLSGSASPCASRELALFREKTAPSAFDPWSEAA